MVGSDWFIDGRFSLTNAHLSRFKQGEGKYTLYGVDHRSVGNLCFLHQEWCKCPMLNINYSLFVFPSLVHFMFAVA